MKKYIPITVVLGLFGLLVVFKHFYSNDDAQPIVGNQNNSVNNVTNTSQQNTPSTGSSSATYKDGTYTGSVADAFYGNIQIQATISGGKITDIQFLQYPNDNGTSREINQQAMSLLKSEAIQSQSASVDIVSGASDSSQAFRESLASALQQAQ